jgi:hypothetical protein
MTDDCHDFKNYLLLFLSFKFNNIECYKGKSLSHHRMGNRWFSFQLHSPLIPQRASFQTFLMYVTLTPDPGHLKNTSAS